MKSFKEYITETSLIEKAEVIDLDEDLSSDPSTSTSGVDMGDAKPLIQKSKVFGHPCIEVDHETFHKCIRGKQPFERWAKYVDDEDLRNEMKKMFKNNQRMLVLNSRDGSLAYVK